jgi:hypothetical protein
MPVTMPMPVAKVLSALAHEIHGLDATSEGFVSGFEGAAAVKLFVVVLRWRGAGGGSVVAHDADVGHGLWDAHVV